MDFRIAENYHICFALVMFASKSNVIFYCYCEERIEGKILHLLALYISYTKYVEVNILRNPNVAEIHIMPSWFHVYGVSNALFLNSVAF